MSRKRPHVDIRKFNELKFADVLSGQDKETVEVTGECVEVKPASEDGGLWRFMLAQKTGSAVYSAEFAVDSNEYGRIVEFLESRELSLDKVLKHGHNISVVAYKKNNWPNRAIGIVTMVRPNSVLDGEIYADKQRGLQELKELGVAQERLSEPRIHYSALEEYPNTDITFRKVLVIGPENSQGIEDFKAQLSREVEKSDFQISYKVLKSGNGMLESLTEHLRRGREEKYDLAIIVRGGGGWEGLRLFDMAETALAVARSEIPVFTAIGHYGNLLLVDRAARISFGTPTSAGIYVNEKLEGALQGRLYPYQRSQRDGPKYQLDRYTHRERPMCLHGSEPRHADPEKEVQDQKLLEAEQKVRRQETLLEKKGAEHAEVSASLQRARADHASDLMVLAERRVRFWHIISSLVAILALIVLAALRGPIAKTFNINLTFWSNFSIIAIAVILIGLLTWLRIRQYKTIGVSKFYVPMKDPPKHRAEWARQLKTAFTVNSLRKAGFYYEKFVQDDAEIKNDGESTPASL